MPFIQKNVKIFSVYFVDAFYYDRAEPLKIEK